MTTMEDLTHRRSHSGALLASVQLPVVSGHRLSVRKASGIVVATLLSILMGLVQMSVGIAGAQVRDAASSLPHVAAASPRGGYVGDEACAPCHQEIAAGYAATAHKHTSQLPDDQAIAGSFAQGSNLLKTSNPYLHFTMTKANDGYFENAVDEVTPSQVVSLTQRIDIVVGSGRKAQTYLYWKGDDLFELPVSWWVASRHWINSPGYADGTINFDRAVVPRCLECHGSFFTSLAPPENHYDKGSLVLGITCEKCHGPGREHVEHSSSASPPTNAAANFILNPAKFSRERQIDACALCHAGAATSLEPPLSFIPGSDLSKYLKIAVSAPGQAVDVHGNQVQLLRESKCFLASAMTCATCHNVHLQQRNAAAYSVHCLSCHQAKQCGEYPKLGEKISQNCIDCHMPQQESKLLFSDSNGETLRPLVRSHRIAIYPSQLH
jgi:hypothetical protein